MSFFKHWLIIVIIIIIIVIIIIIIVIIIIIIIIGTGQLLGIATRYDRDGLRIDSRWGARFFTPVQNGRRAHPACRTKGTGSFPGTKRMDRRFDHPPPSSAEVKEGVEL